MAFITVSSANVSNAVVSFVGMLAVYIIHRVVTRILPYGKKPADGRTLKVQSERYNIIS